MKLEGSLDAFGLPDLFSLLRMTGKTGTLHLRRPAPQGVQEAAVYLSGGRVTGATPDTGRQSLARRIVGAGIVDDDALSAAVDAAASRSIGVARALAEASAVDPDTVRALAEEQARDAVFDLLRWTGGDFTFLVDEHDPNEVGASLDTDQLVTDARARLERWSEISTTIPSPAAVPSLASAPQGDATVSPAEWSLLSMVDGRRSVADMVALSGRGEFAVVEALAGLVQRGLVVVDGTGAGGGVHALARRQGLLARLETSPAEPAAAADDTSGGGAAPVAAPPTAAGPAVVAPMAVPAPTPAPAPSAPQPVLAQASAPDASGGAGTTGPVGVPNPRTVPDRHGGRPVTPARPEVVPTVRNPDHPEPSNAPLREVHAVDGSSARQPEPVADPALGVDPAITKTMLMRLIAGVRGL